MVVEPLGALITLLQQEPEFTKQLNKQIIKTCPVDDWVKYGALGMHFGHGFSRSCVRWDTRRATNGHLL